METYQVKAIVADDGTITIRELPFHAGEQVEVTVRSQDGDIVSDVRYPLRGTPVQYKDPFAGAAADDWEAMQ
jgi:hypothetical protein